MAKLQGLERFSLRTEVAAAIIDPAFSREWRQMFWPGMSVSIRGSGPDARAQCKCPRRRETRCNNRWRDATDTAGGVVRDVVRKFRRTRLQIRQGGQRPR